MILVVSVFSFFLFLPVVSELVFMSLLENTNSVSDSLGMLLVDSSIECGRCSAALTVKSYLNETVSILNNSSGSGFH